MVTEFSANQKMRSGLDLYKINTDTGRRKNQLRKLLTEGASETTTLRIPLPTITKQLRNLINNK